VTPTASIVVVEAARLVEPKEPAEIGKLRVKGSPEPRQELRLDRTGETRAAQRGLYLLVEVRLRERQGRGHQGCTASNRNRQATDTVQA
jgi:hypothetical protein